MYILPYQVDSLKLQWTALFPSTNNPIKRVSKLLNRKKLTGTFKFVLKRMADTLGKVETIYGIDIKKDKIPINKLSLPNDTWINTQLQKQSMP